MGFVNLDFKVRYEDVDKNNYLTFRGFLKYFLDAATAHSNMAGYGLNDITQKHVAWLILDWKLRIYSYPRTDESIHIRTWTRDTTKLYSFRDFEMLDSTGSRIAIASSKWVLIDTDTKAIAKITPEIIESYGPVDLHIFDTDFRKLKEPEVNSSNEFNYTILRRDLDTNKHVNNLNYIDFALEALPENVYENTKFQNVEIMYKKQCLYGDNIKCFYSFDNNEHFVTIKSSDLSELHAIIVLS